MSENGHSFDSVLLEGRRFPPPPEFAANAHVKNFDEYMEMWERSVKDPDGFWAERAESLHWFKKWDRVLSWEPPFARYFEGGKINVSYNCLDRHVIAGKGDKTALIWEGEPEDETRRFSFSELLADVNRAANMLKSLGVKKGDRVCLYLPMIPELAIAMLACARIGAIHSIVFAGFSAESLIDRINDCEAVVVITADASYRGGKVIPLKKAVDAALESCPTVRNTVVVKRTGTEVEWKEGRDLRWEDLFAGASDVCEAEWMDSEDPLFILYTSGTTGKPKGVMHTTAGYLLYVTLTSKLVFDLKDSDVHWCTADIGWVTGHSYIVYGILANGVTTVMFEGVPNYPTKDRFWRVVEKNKVTVFYTAPTALRAMMRDGDDWPNGRDLSSLRLLGSVGEPINPEAWMWYYTVIGKERCPIVDTWWQTETGGILITPLPGAHDLKPGSASFPFPGIDPKILREDGTECGRNEGGYLVIDKPWPGMMRNIWGDPARFKETYFSRYSGRYLTGDGCVRDDMGFYTLMGRVDDVINVSGHRLGTMEIESALVAHEKVAEAAVVPMPHEIKGQGIYAFVTPISGVASSDELKKELMAHVRKEIGPIATPDVIQFADALPKTRSGKIMRRILRKIAEGVTEVGDTTTLADPAVVDRLLLERPERK